MKKMLRVGEALCAFFECPGESVVIFIILTAWVCGIVVGFAMLTSAGVGWAVIALSALIGFVMFVSAALEEVDRQTEAESTRIEGLLEGVVCE